MTARPAELAPEAAEAQARAGLPGGPRPRWPGALVVALVLACGAALAVVLPRAAGLGARHPTAPAGAGPGTGARLLAAVALVALLAHLGGMLARACRQPSVVGQIASGVLLGPSVFGRLVPAVPGALYGPAVLPQLKTLAELGVTFFVLQVGYELGQRRTRAAPPALLLLAAVGVLVPFTLGAAVALAGHSRLAPAGTGVLPFACFLGLALSATALPVLARILADEGLVGSRLGVLALGAAACTDGLVWVGVAVLSATRRGSGPAGAIAPVLVTAGVVAVLVARRGLARHAGALGRLAPGVLLTVLVVAVLLMGSASAAVLGHPGVGALACGLALPAGIAPLDAAMRHLRTVTDALLLPVFFAVAGLTVRLDTLGGSGTLTLLAVVLAAAVAGKLGGCALAARAQDLPWPAALRFGVLMNCRGVTELVLISIGGALGLVGPRLYATLVVLALGSTALTGPLLRLLPAPDARWAAEVPP